MTGMFPCWCSGSVSGLDFLICVETQYLHEFSPVKEPTMLYSYMWLCNDVEMLSPTFPCPPPPLHSYLPSKIAGTTFGVMTMSEMNEKCIFFTMSQAWQLGRAVLRAQHTHTNVLDAITEQQKGIILITGKVSLCREDSPPLDLYPAGSSCVW